MLPVWPLAREGVLLLAEGDLLASSTEQIDGSGDSGDSVDSEDASQDDDDVLLLLPACLASPQPR